MNDNNRKPDASKQSIPSSVNPDAEPVLSGDMEQDNTESESLFDICKDQYERTVRSRPMSNDLETLYKHESECQDCGDSFTSDVQWGRRTSRAGNYLSSWGWDVPAHCDDCAEQYAIEIRHKIDPDEAYLPWWRYFHVHILGKDPAPAPKPPQDEQLETVLELLERVIDPIDGGVDWVINDEEDMAPFWWAREQLDREHYSELQHRAREDYGVDVDELADVGKESVEEYYGATIVE